MKTEKLKSVTVKEFFMVLNALVASMKGMKVHFSSSYGSEPKQYPTNIHDCYKNLVSEYLSTFGMIQSTWEIQFKNEMFNILPHEWRIGSIALPNFEDNKRISSRCGKIVDIHYKLGTVIEDDSISMYDYLMVFRKNKLEKEIADQKEYIIKAEEELLNSKEWLEKKQAELASI